MSQDQRQDHSRIPNWRWILAWVVGIVLYVAVVIVLDERLGLKSKDLLSILIVPVALAVVGYLFTWWQKSRDFAVEEQRLKNARELEQQRAQDEVFQAYLDQMSQPLIDRKLFEVGRYDPVRVLARARTLGVLWKLDANRKRSLMQFLHEARLIRREELRDPEEDWEEPVENPVIGLSGADLRGAFLKWLDLSKADLSGADLSDASLKGANLHHAKVTDKQLDTAKSLKGATMRDGSKHP